MKEQTSTQHWAGIDWGDTEHALCVVSAEGDILVRRRIAQSAEGMETLVRTLRGVPALAGVAIETNRHLMVDVLVNAGFAVYAVNPVMAHAWGKSLSVAAPKDDDRDAWSLARGVSHYHDTLRVIREEDDTMRALRMLCEQEQRLIRQRSARACELKAILKAYYPAALPWFDRFVTPSAWNFILAFPTPQALAQATKQKLCGFCKRQRMALNPRRLACIDARTRATDLAGDTQLASIYAIRAAALAHQLHAIQAGINHCRRAILEHYHALPQAAVFSSLPGAGERLAPRIMCILGSNKDRYESAQSVCELAGLVPVTKQSGKSRHVVFRFSCKKLYRSTMHQFAWLSIRFVPWANAFYNKCRERGQSHPQALRNLAVKWMKIIYRMWQEDRPYDDERYIKALQRANSPLVNRIAQA